jgi:UDP:flavonoid glycosyltransferase YjiC (YdhE family)
MTESVLVAYLSGHGYGHFARSAAVLERLAGHVAIHLRTNERALEMARAARWAASTAEVDVGPGLVQRGPLAMDPAATRDALAAHLDAWPRTLEREAAFLREVGARVVWADVPPIAFAAAARAGVPSVGTGNFSWSWIYDGLAGADPFFAAAAARLRAAEGEATQFLALDFGGGLDVFPRRTPIAPLAPAPTMTRAAARARLPFADADDARPIVLVSFGGFGRELQLDARTDGRHRLLVLAAPLAASLERDDLRAFHLDGTLPHADLVAAVDCVISKPGYGTVAECLRAGTPLVYVRRDEPREGPALAAAIERHLPCAALAVEDLLAWRWPTIAAAVDRALRARPRLPLAVGDGPAEAAAHLLGRL